MADKKVTQLAALTAPNKNDLLLVVDDPAGTPVSKKITIENLLGATTPLEVVAVNIDATGQYRISGNTVLIEADTGITANGDITVTGAVDAAELSVDAVTPSSSNNLVQGWGVGRIGWDANYLYVAISSSQIARVALDISW
jgi:uncharacterized protein (DUF342 family)